jgi:hypothetical protein
VGTWRGAAGARCLRPEHADEPRADLRPAVAHLPDPPAPIDQQAVSVGAQHSALDLVGAAGRQAAGVGRR